MKYFVATILVLEIGLAAYLPGSFSFSRYYNDWDSIVPDCWYNDPVICALDGECGEKEACYQGFCYDVRKYHCVEQDKCESGTSLDPLRYCECIPESEVKAMFCEAAYETEGEEANPDEISDSIVNSEENSSQEPWSGNNVEPETDQPNNN